MPNVLYLKNLLHGNLGLSEQSHRPVLTDLEEYVPATIELALFAIVVSLVTGIGLGIVAAMYRDRWPDHLIRVISLGGVSMPVFWIALVAFYLLFFNLGWLPGGGRLDPTQGAPHHLTGTFTADAALHGQWTLFWSALHPGDTGGQARACLARVEEALAALGAGREDIIRTTVYLAPGASWEQAARAHREMLGDVRPASTMLYVGGLIGDGFLVEIEAQAVVDP